MIGRIYTRILSWALLILLIGSGASCTNPPENFHEINQDKVVKYTAAGAVQGAVVGTLAGAGAAMSGPFAAAGAGVGAFAGAALGMLNSQEQLPPREILIDAGVQIVEVGEDTLLFLPSSLFFYNNSSHVNEGYYSVLNAMVRFINEYDIQTIKTAGYTDLYGDQERNLALSRQQAQNIAKYLQGMGVKAAYLYSVGYGSLYPVAFNEKGRETLMNRRVEITFRRLAFDSYETR